MKRTVIFRVRLFQREADYIAKITRDNQRRLLDGGWPARWTDADTVRALMESGAAASVPCGGVPWPTDTQEPT